MNPRNKHPFRGEGESYFWEGRVVWRTSSPERPSESIEGRLDQILQNAGVPQENVEGTRQQLGRIFGQSRRGRGQAEESREGTGDQEETPDLSGLSDNPEIAQRQVEQARHQADIHRARWEAEQNTVVDRRPLLKNAGRTAAVAGGAAMIPSSLAYLSHLGSGYHVIGGLGSAGAGALLGDYVNRKWIKDRTRNKKGFPVAAPTMGATLGVMGAPLIQPTLTGMGGFLASNAAATGILFSLGAGTLSGIGMYKLARVLNLKGIPKVAATAAGGVLGAGLSSYYLGGIFSGGASSLIAQLGNGMTWLGSAGSTYLPSYAALGGMLPGSASLGLTVGAGAAALYALGRLDGKIWKRKKTGILGNVLRGVIAPVTVPTGAALGTAGWSIDKARRFVGRNWDATKRIVTGKSPAVKAVTSPIWWPIRTAYRTGRGIVGGFWRGLTGKKASKAMGIVEKVSGAIPKIAGKVIASPYTFGKWLYEFLLSKQK